MEKRFKKGDELYLMVTVHDTEPTLRDGYDYTVEWKDVVDGMACLASVGQAQLVSDADFGTSIDWQAKYNEYNEKAEGKIRELATRLNGMAESLREAQAKAVSLNSALKAQNDANLELEDKNAMLARKNDELDKRNAELSVLIDKLRKEIAQREELWGNVSNNNDIAVYNLNRLCKQREVLTDRIIALEAELEAEREKHNG
jgi:chromosome segregation ATPase